MDIVAEFKTQNSAMFPKGSALALTARSKALNIPVPKNRASSASSVKRPINPSSVSSPQNLFALWQENRGKSFISVGSTPNKSAASPLPSRDRGSSFSFGDNSEASGKRPGALPVIKSAIESAITPQEPLAEAVLQHGLSLMKAQRSAVVQNPAAQVEIFIPVEQKSEPAVTVSSSSSSAAVAQRGASPAPAAESRSSPLTLPVASNNRPMRRKLRFADPLVYVEPRARSNSDSLSKLPAANSSTTANNGNAKTTSGTVKSILKTSVQWSQPPSQPLQQRSRPYSGGGNTQNTNSPINSTITAIHTMNNTLSNKNIPVVSVMQPVIAPTHTLSLQQQLMQHQQQHHQQHQYSTQLQPAHVQRPSTASGALGTSYAHQGFNPRDSLTAHSSELLRRTMQLQLANSGAADVADAQQQLSDNFSAPNVTFSTPTPLGYEDIDPSALRLPVSSASALFVLPAKSVSLGTLVCASAAPVAFFAEHLSLYCQAPCEAARCITVRYRDMSGASLIGLRLRFKVPASLLSSDNASVDPSSNLTFVLVDFAASARIQQLRERLLPLIADAQVLSRASSASSSRQAQNLHLMSQQSAASAAGNSQSQSLVLR